MLGKSGCELVSLWAPGSAGLLLVASRSSLPHWSNLKLSIIVQGSSLDLPCQERNWGHHSSFPLPACLPWIMQFVSSMECIQNNRHSNKQTADHGRNPLTGGSLAHAAAIRSPPGSHHFIPIDPLPLLLWCGPMIMSLPQSFPWSAASHTSGDTWRKENKDAMRAQSRAGSFSEEVCWVWELEVKVSLWPFGSSYGTWSGVKWTGRNAARLCLRADAL